MLPFVTKASLDYIRLTGLMNWLLDLEFGSRHLESIFKTRFVLRQVFFLYVCVIGVTKLLWTQKMTSF